MHANSAGIILRRRAQKAGLMIRKLARLSLHGLRAGFVTEAFKPGHKTKKSWGKRGVATWRRCAAMSVERHY